MFKSFCNLCDEKTPHNNLTTSMALPQYSARVEVRYQPLRHGSDFHICRPCRIALLERLLEHLKGD